MRAFLSTGRAVQTAWLLFTLLALSLALPGIAPYRRLLGTICTDADCLTGQLRPAEVQSNLGNLRIPLLEYARNAIIAYLLTYGLTLLTAAALIRYKPRQRAAVFGAFALSAAGTGTLAQATARTVPLMVLPAQLIHFVQLAALLPFFGLIPDGKFRPGWLRWMALAIVPAAALVAFDLVGAAVGNALNLILAAHIIGSLIYRYRLLTASSQQERVAWALAAAALLTIAPWIGRPLQLPPLDAIPTTFFTASLFATFLVVGALTCLAVAFLRDELFQVDVVLNRALVYTLLSLFVVAGYVLVVGYLSLIFQSSGSLWFSLVATGLVAALFQPVRRRLQRFVNHMLYGERVEPYEVIASLGRRLEATFAPEAVLPTIVQMVEESLQLPYVAITLEEGGVSQVAAIAGVPQGEPISFPLTYQGALVGQLLVNARPGDDGLDAADRALLTDLAQQAGIAVHGVRLTAELKRMADKLQDARERLVLALEDERRRLRRDLHDDLAPTLVGLSLRAGAIGDLLETDPAKAKMLADDLDGAIRDAVGNIRRLVYDLRPPALDDLGLLAAIRERASDYSSGELHVTVITPDTLPPLPAAVEVAAYRIVQEALTNVVKHARALTCHVRVTLGDGLSITVVDDGIGLPATQHSGVGLRSIRERAEELGGKCEMTNNAGQGTRIAVLLPLERRDRE